MNTCEPKLYIEVNKGYSELQRKYDVSLNRIHITSPVLWMATGFKTPRRYTNSASLNMLRLINTYIQHNHINIIEIQTAVQWKALQNTIHLIPFSNDLHRSRCKSHLINFPFFSDKFTHSTWASRVQHSPQREWQHFHCLWKKERECLHHNTERKELWNEQL